MRCISGRSELIILFFPFSTQLFQFLMEKSFVPEFFRKFSTLDALLNIAQILY